MVSDGSVKAQGTEPSAHQSFGGCHRTADPPFWINGAGSGLSEVYDAGGNSQFVVRIPAAGGATTSGPKCYTASAVFYQIRSPRLFSPWSLDPRSTQIFLSPQVVVLDRSVTALRRLRRTDRFWCSRVPDGYRATRKIIFLSFSEKRPDGEQLCRSVTLAMTRTDTAPTTNRTWAQIVARCTSAVIAWSRLNSHARPRKRKRISSVWIVWVGLADTPTYGLSDYRPG